MRQEPALPNTRPEFRPFLTFLLETQGQYVEKHGKKKPDVPIMLAGNALKPYFELSEENGFDLIHPSMPEAEECRKKIVDALTGPYGKTDRTRARPLFRSLSHESSLLDKVDGIRMTELVGVAGNDLGYLGDAELEETMIGRINRLIPLVHAAVAANLPNTPQKNDERWACVDRLKNVFVDWTMAIVYATAFTAAIDDKKAFTMFAQLARVQLRTFITGIDPYTNGQLVVAYTR